jgi:RNA polymerase sigma-70 factor (ECF subfamily)
MDPQDDLRLRDLMVAYQAGDYEAFEELYRVLHARVRAQLRASVGEPARAEDLTQEVFLQLHRARRTYDRAYPVLPWVSAIARHVVQMDRRTAGRRAHLMSAAVDEAPEPVADARTPALHDGAPVRDALSRIAPEKRHAMLLHHVAGWSFREIARRFGIRESAAKLRSSRGVRQLRDLLRK